MFGFEVSMVKPNMVELIIATGINKNTPPRRKDLIKAFSVTAILALMARKDQLWFGRFPTIVAIIKYLVLQELPGSVCWGYGF